MNHFCSSLHFCNEKNYIGLLVADSNAQIYEIGVANTVFTVHKEL